MAHSGRLLSSNLRRTVPQRASELFGLECDRHDSGVITGDGRGDVRRRGGDRVHHTPAPEALPSGRRLQGFPGLTTSVILKCRLIARTSFRLGWSWEKKHPSCQAFLPPPGSFPRLTYASLLNPMLCIPLRGNLHVKEGAIPVPVRRGKKSAREVGGYTERELS